MEGTAISFFFLQKQINFEKIKEETEAVMQKCSVKKVFLEILQNSQENTCAKVATLSKKDSGTGLFL